MAEPETNIAPLVAGRENWTKLAAQEQSEANLAEQIESYLTDAEPKALIQAYMDRKRAKADFFRKLAYAAAQAIEGLQSGKSENE